MGQIHGSGAGNWNNAAVVDNSEGSMQGRLFVNSSGISTQVYDGADGPAQLDPATYALEVIDYAHHKVHGGTSYTVQNFTVLGNNDSISFGVNTPDSSKWIHMTFNSQATGQTEIEIWEDADLTGGSPVTPVCRNRNSNISSSVTVSGWAAVNTTSGTLLSRQAFGLSTTPSKFFGGEDRSTQEFVLKSGATYLFNAISRNAGNIVTGKLDWYEHTDKVAQF